MVEAAQHVRHGQGAGLAVLAQVGQLVPAVRGQRHHRDDPGAQAGQREHDERPAVRQLDHDPVAGPQPKPGQPRQIGANPAQVSRAPGQATPQLDLSQEIKQSASEWGKISPRTRNAVIEGSSEQIIEKYRRYVEDYYKGVAVRGSERQ